MIPLSNVMCSTLFFPCSFNIILPFEIPTVVHVLTDPISKTFKIFNSFKIHIPLTLYTDTDTDTHIQNKTFSLIVFTNYPPSRQFLSASVSLSLALRASHLAPFYTMQLAPCANYPAYLPNPLQATVDSRRPY